MVASFRHRILLLDSDSAYLARLFDVLAMGYEVVVRNDSVSALNKLHHYEPDVVVLDTNLPEIDGFEFARLMRRRVEHHTVPIVFLAGSLTEADRRVAGMVGAMLCLTKDMALGHIAAEISRLIQRTPVLVREKQFTLGEIAAMQHEEAVRETIRPRKPIGHSGKSAEGGVSGADRLAVSGGVGHAGDATEGGDLGAMGPGGGADGGGAVPVVDALPRRRPRVLIAHPEPVQLADFFNSLLDMCDCIGAQSGLEAVEKAGRYRPDVLIVNMRLPGMQGFEVSQMLHGEPHFAEMPIMGLVDEGDSLVHRDMWRYGVTRLFVMPAERQKVLEELNEFSQGPLFRPHPYPQTFGEVVAEEEAKRRVLEQRLALRQKKQEQDEFRRFFREASGGGAPGGASPG